MASPPSTQVPPTRTPLPLQYTGFVEKLASRNIFSRFLALKSFLNLFGAVKQGIPAHVSSPVIKLGSFSGTNGRFSFEDVEPIDLASSILRDEPQLFIVDNITPDIIKTLGGHLDVDPQFFLDYIDAIPGDFDITQEQKSPRPDIIPTPWFRLRDVQGHLPLLSSLSSRCQHVSLHFIGPKEYDRPGNRQAGERVDPDLEKMNVERTAGLHIPIARDIAAGGRQFHNVAMARSCASVWFQKPKSATQSRWTKGIILLDPPFEPLDTLGSKVLASSYRSFQCRPLFSDQDNGGLDKRGSYVDSVVEYLEHLNIRDHSDFHPLVVIKGVTYIVASEWITTNAYIERDLNTIEWMLESTKLDLEVFEKLLSKLFTHRRRIGKYASLVDNQAELFETGLPALWDNTTGSHLAKEALRDIRSNATQVRCVVKRNADRVGRSVDFLVSMMSIREGEQSVKQNHMLMFLTSVATFALPFTAVAAILGIQTKYGPENEGFWVFWAGSSAAWVCIAAVYMVMSLVKRFKRQREV